MEARTNELIQRFLRWYNNKDVVPTFEAMQKMIVFYRDKDIDVLKLGCALLNLANFCLHKATYAKFYPITEGANDFLEENREAVVGGPSIVFTRKAVVDKTFIRNSTNICKTIVGIDASQLYSYSNCQPMPTGLIRVGISIQKRVDSYLDKTRPAALRIWSRPISKEQDQNVKVKASLQQADRKKLTASVLTCFVLIAILYLKPWLLLPLLSLSRVASLSH